MQGVRSVSGSKGVSKKEIISAQSNKHWEVNTESAGPRMVTTDRWGSDITKGILQKVTLELILRMKRNLASQRERKVLQAENRIQT